MPDRFLFVDGAFRLSNHCRPLPQSCKDIFLEIRAFAGITRGQVLQKAVVMTIGV